MRYRVRGILKAGNIPVIHKIDGADNPYDAAAQAAKILRSEGHDPSQVGSLSVKPMKEAKSKATYFGKATTGRKGPIGRAPAAAPASTPTPTPAVTTASKMETPKPAAPAKTK